MSVDGDHGPARLGFVALRPYEDARQLVRLFQCSQCSYPIRQPMTFPCGNSICRQCLPPLYTRENITYPQNIDRAQGFVCPFKDCSMEHSLADCSLDVTLNKLMEVVQSCMNTFKSNMSETSLMLEERLHWKKSVDNAMDVMPRSRMFSGGRIVSTFTFASMGGLSYDSDITYTPVDPEKTDHIISLDNTVANDVCEAIRGELECHVCYALMLDPLTTTCGHTFCRKCVARVLDHSNLCPVCRRPLPMPPGASTEPSNKRISQCLHGLLTEEVQLRSDAAEQEDAIDEETMLPLFACTLGYPQMPTFLHIFEPRYRLMIRRCLESGTRRFGMMMYNSRRTPQGALGSSPFMQYGTLLHIQRVEVFPDGRSLIETQGLSRFRILETSLLDGYNVGRVQRIDDIALAEEEAIEAQETSGPEPATDDLVGQINHMSTQRLLQYGLDFIALAQATSADWLHERVLAAYGQPPTDPTIFPYWFASVLPIAEEAKYALLPTVSVRERLKMTAGWIQQLEQARCRYEAALANRVMRLSRVDNEDTEAGIGNESQISRDPEETRTLRGQYSERDTPTPAPTSPESSEQSAQYDSSD